MGIAEFSTIVSTFNGILNIFRSARELLPTGTDKREQLDEKIETAEMALRKANAELAKSLGYKQCQCTFPPQTMLWREDTQAYVCPNPSCGHVHSKLRIKPSRSYSPFQRI